MGAAPHNTPCPFGLTSEQWLEACVGAMTSSAAIARYRGTFRRGGSEAVGVAPISRIAESDSPEGRVIKFTQRVPAEAGGTGDGGPEVESVIVPMIGIRGARTLTLCVSSQAGCAMGCLFCETARMGLFRSLTPAEIVGQWYAARHVLGYPIRNVVFMGMGEPLDNYDAVIRSIGVLTDHHGPALAMKNITISTAGRIDGLHRLAEQIRRPGWHRLGVSVSLNAPTDEIRSRIMPINRAMPMSELREALLALPRFGRKRLAIGYVLIPGVNDAAEHAAELCRYLAPLREDVLVNVIPYNPRPGSPWVAPSDEDLACFLGRIIDAGYLCRRRRTKGREMMGACGQLGSAVLARGHARGGSAAALC